MTDYRKAWQEAFDELLQFGSQGAFEKEILRAKELFYQNLGRSHEMGEAVFESASQTFLEWYLFEYVTRNFQKTPAVIFVTLGVSSEFNLRAIERSLCNHWSIFKVLKISSTHVVVKDLLWDKNRNIRLLSEGPESRMWVPKTGQVFQARLFPVPSSDELFYTHIWLHPEKEFNLIENLCAKRTRMWSLHKTLLLASFEAAIRSFGIEKQLTISQASNWNYAELMKRYAEAN